MSDDTLIFGPGRVGSTLAVALDRRAWPISAIGGRNAEVCSALAARLRTKVAHGTLGDLGGPYPVVLLAVSDDAIGAVADALASRGVVSAGSVLLHLSGVHSSTILEKASGVGAAVGSMHPLQTFPDTESGLRALPDSHWFIEGDRAAVEVASRLVACLQGCAHLIATANKVLYHASASIACNLMTALLDAALDAAEAAGLERSAMLEALHPLLRAGLDNALASGTGPSLTGPISRGDVATVALHLEAVAGIDELGRLYRVLGERSVAMARSIGRIDEKTASALARCLAKFDPGVLPRR